MFSTNAELTTGISHCFMALLTCCMTSDAHKVPVVAYGSSGIQFYMSQSFSACEFCNVVEDGEPEIIWEDTKLHRMGRL